MEYKEAAERVRKAGASRVSGNVHRGQMVIWQNSKFTFTFVPRHAYATDGDLLKKKR